MVQFLKRNNAPDLAYIASNTGNIDLPTLMFLGGFRSDMEGTKAIFLEQECANRNQSFVRFDYSGHGQSEGKFEEGCISDWANDALTILEECTSGPVMLVGSSMGGWISLLLAIKKPDRIHSIIGLAAAPDFTKIMEERMSQDQKNALDKEGYFELPNDYDEPYIITKKLIEDGRNNCVLDKKIGIKVPVRLIQGKKDTDVEWQTADKIKSIIASENVQVILLDEADHRLSSPEQLQFLNHIILELLK